MKLIPSISSTSKTPSNQAISTFLIEDLLPDQTVSVKTCAVIYEHDLDFGSVNVVDFAVQRPDRSSKLPPSQKIDSAKLAHLSARQREKLLSVLDAFPDCFCDTPAFVTLSNMRYQSRVISNLRDFELIKFQNY